MFTSRILKLMGDLPIPKVRIVVEKRTKKEKEVEGTNYPEGIITP